MYSSVRLLSFIIVFGRFIHVAYIIYSFSLLCYYFTVWIYHNSFTHPIVDRNLGCLQFRTIKNKAAINILYISLADIITHYGFIHRTGIAAS